MCSFRFDRDFFFASLVFCLSESEEVGTLFAVIAVTMSVVLSLKRPLGYVSPDQHGYDESNRFAKRCRSFTATSPKSQGLAHRTRPQTNPTSLFQPLGDHNAAADADPLQQLKRRKYKKLDKSMEPENDVTGAAGSAVQTSGSNTTGADQHSQHNHQQNQHQLQPRIEEGEILFTLSQVRSLIASAVAAKEAELTERYDRILNDRLQEQFNLFTKFNEDHIHQKLSHSQHMYMS